MVPIVDNISKQCSSTLEKLEELVITLEQQQPETKVDDSAKE